MLPWAVRELGSGQVIGSTRYHDVVEPAGRVEIGFTWYAARWQRTHVNTTCKLLLFRHAFETLGCGVVGLRTDVLNLRSQRAIERLGARRDGVIRRAAVRRDGSVRDTVMYSVLAEEWPEVRERLLEWVARSSPWPGRAEGGDLAVEGRHALLGVARAPGDVRREDGVE